MLNKSDADMKSTIYVLFVSILLFYNSLTFLPLLYSSRFEKYVARIQSDFQNPEMFVSDGFKRLRQQMLFGVLQVH